MDSLYQITKGTCDYEKLSARDRSASNNKTATKGLVLCKACNKEYTPDAYLDHVYDNPECYKLFLASEKKEMSKQ